MPVEKKQTDLLPSREVCEAKLKLYDIPCFGDAMYAGGHLSSECTLILSSEGSSARFLVDDHLDLDYYGTFSMRGKPLLNVREASHKQIMKNAKIKYIIKILGLEYGKVYDNDNVKSLRYGNLMIMTNQNEDGFHMKGLLINLFHCLWPSLLKIPFFLGELMIPEVEATHIDGGHVRYFYNMPQYESWKGGERAPNDWSIKYYKGMQSRTPKEAKEYFQNFETHKKYFTWVDERDEDAIDMAFSKKKKIEARKTWLQQYEPDQAYLDRKEKLIKYSDFVNKELIQFFMADMQRFIPSMVDGLTLDQRRVLFWAFKCNYWVTEETVALFSAQVSSHFDYHNGENAGTIVRMAQDFVGSNNINLFNASGPFGTRYEGCDHYGSTRFININLTPIAQFLFPKDDDILNQENNQLIEPTWYAPVIPMILVNGTNVSEGYSSFVPSYDPRELCANVRRLLRGEPMVPMVPWYKGFKGTIEKTTMYLSNGIIRQINETTLRIMELPIGKWTKDYMEFLDKKMKTTVIKECYKATCPNSVDFKIIMSKEKLQKANEKGLMSEFELTAPISTTNNMLLFDPNGVIKEYDNPEQILKEFFSLRLNLYKKRQEMMVKAIALELSVLRESISSMSDRKITFMGLYDAIIEAKKSIEESSSQPCSESQLGQLVENSQTTFQNYIKGKVIELRSQEANKMCLLRNLSESTPAALWIKDLDALEEKLNELLDPRDEVDGGNLDDLSTLIFES